MKNYTAIQNTPSITGMRYSFKAKSLNEAEEKAKALLSGEIVEVFEVDDLGKKKYTCNL